MFVLLFVQILFLSCSALSSADCESLTTVAQCGAEASCYKCPLFDTNPANRFVCSSSSCATFLPQFGPTLRTIFVTFQVDVVTSSSVGVSFRCWPMFDDEMIFKLFADGSENLSNCKWTDLNTLEIELAPDYTISADDDFYFKVGALCIEGTSKCIGDAPIPVLETSPFEPIASPSYEYADELKKDDTSAVILLKADLSHVAGRIFELSDDEDDQQKPKDTVNVEWEYLKPEVSSDELLQNVFNSIEYESRKSPQSESIRVTFPTTTNFVVKLTVTDCHGVTDEAELAVNVFNDLQDVKEQDKKSYTGVIVAVVVVVVVVLIACGLVGGAYYIKWLNGGSLFPLCPKDLIEGEDFEYDSNGEIVILDKNKSTQNTESPKREKEKESESASKSKSESESESESEESNEKEIALKML